MPEAKFLDQRVAVCGQLKPVDMDDVARQGFATIINNRPDGEVWFGQPPAGELHTAASAVGIASHYLPFTLQTLSPADVRRFKAILDSTTGRVLVFCASGFRSALIWAMAGAALAGEPVDSLLQAASAAGAAIGQAPRQDRTHARRVELVIRDRAGCRRTISPW